MRISECDWPFKPCCPALGWLMSAESLTGHRDGTGHLYLRANRGGWTEITHCPYCGTKLEAEE